MVSGNRLTVNRAKGLVWTEQRPPVIGDWLVTAFFLRWRFRVEVPQRFFEGRK